MTPTRVLIVVTSNERRGAEVEGLQLAAELTAAGLVAEAVALSPGAIPSLDVACLGAAPLALETLWALRSKAGHFDVVVAYGSSALPACAIALFLTGVPFVYRSIGDPARWVRGRTHRLRTRLLFRRAAHVVALWPAAAESIAAMYAVPAARLSCIANARTRDAEVINRSDARSMLGLPADGAVVAWVGALSAEKRAGLAVDAMAATPDGFLAIAGDGPERAMIARLCEQRLPGRHAILGVVVPLAPVWSAADVVLLTSRTEGMPGVLIEAALSGVPAVATDVGAVSSVIVDGTTGRLVSPDAAPETLASAVEEVLAERAAMGSAAESHASAAFTWGVVRQAWVGLLDDVTSR